MSSNYRVPSEAAREIGGYPGPGEGPLPPSSRGLVTPPYYERVFIDVDNAAPTAKKDQNLQVACRRVVVYNYTPCYVHIVDADMWVPPFIFGAVLPLVSGVTVARIRYEPPPAQAQPAGVVGNRCICFFTVEDLAPNPGIRYTP